MNGNDRLGRFEELVLLALARLREKLTATAEIPIIKRLKWHTKGSTKHFAS
jgi:hypothetical protein